MKKMIKENRLNIILSSIITIFPMLVGAVLWNKLPSSMATHFGTSGAADGFSSKAFAIFGLPLILFAFHWLMIFSMSLDKNVKEQSKKMTGILLYLMPLVSVISCSIVYSNSLEMGSEKAIFKIFFAFLAFLLIAAGNYLPKLTTNSTIGIKIPWVYTSEENWRKTHRFGGRTWVAGGFVVLCSVLLPSKWTIALLLVVIAIAVIVPTVYSYRLYKKEYADGKCQAVKQTLRTTDKNIAIVSSVLITALLIAVAVIMFTGNIDVIPNSTCISIKADYYKDSVVSYSDIASIELRKTDDPGTKTNGFNSARLLMGSFRNDEFGSYTRYTYRGKDCCIIMKDKEGNVMVLGAKSDEETKMLYEEIEQYFKQNH